MRIALGIISLFIGIILFITSSSAGLSPVGWVFAFGTLLGGAFAFKRSDVSFTLYLFMWALGLLASFGDLPEEIVTSLIATSILSLIFVLFARAAFKEQRRADEKRV